MECDFYVDLQETPVFTSNFEKTIWSIHLKEIERKENGV